eukprot:TRINITY_DN36288_c0_g1_i1.p1 TRINITY_DN36288_c0_g1~~TRINITY_DN36288_c0_g1_i1.p1  ORF type:complete len:285 (+),score=80.55 TRINITY_DN36288_c0_g1_i1:518-1372(+)
MGQLVSALRSCSVSCSSELLRPALLAAALNPGGVTAAVAADLLAAAGGVDARTPRVAVVDLGSAHDPVPPKTRLLAVVAEDLASGQRRRGPVAVSCAEAVATHPAASLINASTAGGGRVVAVCSGVAVEERAGVLHRMWAGRVDARADVPRDRCVRALADMLSAGLIRPTSCALDCASWLLLADGVGDDAARGLAAAAPPPDAPILALVYVTQAAVRPDRWATWAARLLRAAAAPPATWQLPEGVCGAAAEGAVTAACVDVAAAAAEAEVWVHEDWVQLSARMA